MWPKNIDFCRYSHMLENQINLLFEKSLKNYTVFLKNVHIL